MTSVGLTHELRDDVEGFKTFGQLEQALRLRVGQDGDEAGTLGRGPWALTLLRPADPRMS